MNNDNKPEKKKMSIEKAMTINHYAVGLTLLMKGLDKLDYFDKHPFSVFFFFIAGAVIIFGTLLHHQIAKIYKNFNFTFFLFEAVALILAGIILYEKGGSKIPYFFFFLGLVYLILGFTNIFSNDENRERVVLKMARYLGYLFILFGTGTIIINIIYFNSIWMYIISLMLVLVGFVIPKAELLMKKYYKV